MLAEERRQQIIMELQRAGQVRTRQLADLFEVSEVTIRSDLEIMDARKMLIKTHGGAMAVPMDSPGAEFDERMKHNAAAKRRIAALAAREITDNQSIIFDGGSTLLQVAMFMPPVNNVVVATNAMNIAQQLMCRDGIDVHMIGGRVFPGNVSTLITEPASILGGLVAHQVFVGAHAIDSSLDIVDVSEDIARTKRNLVSMARRVVLVADSSKWNVGATSKAFSLSQAHLVITDSDMPDGIRKRLEEEGIEVKYA